MVDSKLAFDIMARDDGASAVLDKIARASDRTGASLKKTGRISDDVAKSSTNLTSARNRETNALDRVQVAEARLAEVRGNSKSKVSQIIAAEKALSKARRDAAMAGDIAQKATRELSQALDNEGKKAGRGFGANLKKWLTGSGGGMMDAGKAGGTVFGSGFLGVLKTPVLGPAVAAIIGGAVLTAMPAIGATAGSALVTGLGAGLVGLGAVFAAKSEKVKSAWRLTIGQLGSDMQLLSKPFESTLVNISAYFKRTVDHFNPYLAQAFARLAPITDNFVDRFLKSTERLAPSFDPLITALDKVMKSESDGLDAFFNDLATSVERLSTSVAKGPDGLADMTKGLGDLVSTSVDLITSLNDANTEFDKLTGGVSLVDVTFKAVQYVIGPVVGLFKGLAKGIELVNVAIGKTNRDMPDAGKSMSDAANDTVKLAQGLKATGDAAQHGAGPMRTLAERVAAAKKEAQEAKQRFEDFISTLFRLQGLALNLSGAQVALQAAIDNATSSIKENGRHLDINTEKGRNNRTALNDIASAANAQTEAMIRGGKGLNAASLAASQSRTSFISLAMKMGLSRAAAKALADQLIAVPKAVKTTVSNNAAGKPKTDAQKYADILRGTLPTVHTTVTTNAGAAPKTAAQKYADILRGTLPTVRTTVVNTAPAATVLADKYRYALGLTPKSKSTTISTPGAAESQGKVGGLLSLLSALPSSKTIRINTYKTQLETVVHKDVGVRVAGAKAAGGPVSGGSAYLVGEKGPEIMVPSSNGNIIPNHAISVGKNVVSGMASGISGSASSAIASVGEVAASMIAKAKDVLQISSPSKAFAQIGLYVNQGFSQGIRGSAKSVQATFTSLMSKVLNISFNIADAKKSAQKAVATYSAQVAAATTTASRRAAQARLRQAQTELRNVNSIGGTLGTTKRRNAVIGMLQRENVAMQAIAKQRAVVATSLKNAQARLAAAIQIRDEFKKSITESALSFNSITAIQPPDGRTHLAARDIIEQMQSTLERTRQFATNLARLKKLGIRSDLYKQIAEAGVDAGGATATALLGGGKGAVTQVNNIQAQISSAATNLGSTAASNMYQAGVNAAQGLVNGLLAKTKALSLASKKLADAIVAQIKKTLGIRSPSKVLAWHGSMAGQGFVQGIVGEYANVRRAGVGLGAAATPGRLRPVGSRTSPSSGEQRIVFEFKSDGSPYMDFLVKEFRKYVAAYGGGDVQKALGSNR